MGDAEKLYIARTKLNEGHKDMVVDFSEIMRQINRQEMKSWLQPKSGDLLLDVMFFQQQIARQTNVKLKGVFARGTIVMAAATIEAVTNDALATIYELLTDAMPSESAGDPPWCYFAGRSSGRVGRLLQNGSVRRKRQYVVEQIERVTGDIIDPSLSQRIDALSKHRNRIVHMSFQEQPGKYKPVLTGKEAAHIAKVARATVEDYLDFLSYEFSEINLPIQTIRSPWHFEKDLHTTRQSER